MRTLPALVLATVVSVAACGGAPAATATPEGKEADGDSTAFTADGTFLARAT